MFSQSQLAWSARPWPSLNCGCQSQRRIEFMLPTLLQEKEKNVARVILHASGDKRFKILETHMKKHQFRHDALIEILHKAQELFGYLEDDLLLFVACKLKLPASRVYRSEEHTSELQSPCNLV